MKNFIDTTEHVDGVDLALNKNARKALENAMAYYRDGCIANYFIILVEGYKCIAHSTDEFYPYELDETIFPFDNDKIYPMQGLVTEYAFKKTY